MQTTPRKILVFMCFWSISYAKIDSESPQIPQLFGLKLTGLPACSGELFLLTVVFGSLFYLELELFHLRV